MSLLRLFESHNSRTAARLSPRRVQSATIGNAYGYDPSSAEPGCARFLLLALPTSEPDGMDEEGERAVNLRRLKYFVKIVDIGSLTQAADVLLRHPQVLVMTDDIYEHIRFDGQTTPHFLQAAPELRDRTLVVNGVSKTYAMTGWRIGYVAGPRDLVQALDTLLSQSTGNCCSISQAAAAAALNGDQSFVAESVAIYKQRRDATLARINAIPGLSCRVPDGAFYLYIGCAGLIGKRTPAGKVLAQDGDVVMYLLDSVGVAVVAGTAYGLSPYFRLSIATSIEVLEEGCKRIASAVAELH